MLKLHTHTATINNRLYNYVLFDSVTRFHNFVDSEIRNLSTANRKVFTRINAETKSNLEHGSDWYGTPPPENITALDEHYQFLGMHLLKEIQPKIKKQLEQYLNHLATEVLPKPQIDYNDKGLGMFSFDKAALGLYQLPKIDIATSLEKTTTQLSIALNRNKTKINTSIKKVYAHFKDKELGLPSLRLYLMAGANANIEGNQLLYVGLACAELVDFMEQRGVSVEVNVLLGTTFNDLANLGAIRIKRFQDKLDKNQLLLMSSDPRYFRYRGFKSLIALSNYFGTTIPTSLGSIQPNMGNDFVKGTASDGFVFEQSYSLATAAKEVSRIIENYTKKLRDEKKA